MKRPDSLETKECPFCGETIKMEAIKCRFCAEYLTPHIEPARPSSDNNAESEREEDDCDEGVLYFATPSLFSLAGAFIKLILMLGVAAVLLIFRMEVWLKDLVGEDAGLTADHYFIVGAVRQGAAIVIITAVVVWFLYRLAVLKSTCYEVTPDRIEFARGIFDRKISNIDMFRIVDISLRRNFVDCILGIGTVDIITTDKTDPNFSFEKVPDARYLYDVIKRESAGADRKRGVVHLE